LHSEINALKYFKLSLEYFIAFSGKKVTLMRV